MGMFDSLYAPDGTEWQTKALACLLDRYDVGDEVPGPPIDYQMEVIGGRDGAHERSRWAFATIRAGRLTDLPCERDQTLPVCAYSSGWGDEYLMPAEVSS